MNISMKTYLDRLLVVLLVPLEVPQPQTLRPIPLVQIHQHRLLQLRLPVVHGDRVIMPVQPMDQGLNAGLVDMTDIGCRLTGLLTSEDCMWVYESEGVNDDLSFDRLNGVDHDRDRTGGEGFE